MFGEDSVPKLFKKGDELYVTVNKEKAYIDIDKMTTMTQDQLGCLLVSRLWNEYIGGPIFHRKIEVGVIKIIIITPLLFINIIKIIIIVIIITINIISTTPGTDWKGGRSTRAR